MHNMEADQLRRLSRLSLPAVPRSTEDDHELVLGDRFTEDDYYLYLVARWPASMPPEVRALLPDAP